MEVKLLYLSPYFWPEEIGSAPYATSLALWLKQRGYDVDVLTFRPHYPSPASFAPWQDGSRDHESIEGISIDRIPARARGKGGFGDRLKNDLSFFLGILFPALKGKFRGAKTIIVYVPTILGMYAARIVRFFTGAPIFCIVHDIESGLAESLGLAQNRILLFLMRLFERIGLNFSQEIVVLTEEMKKTLVALGCVRPITVLPIWADVAEFVPVDRSQTPLLLYSGNFGKKQNLFQLLPLIRQLSEEKKNVAIHLRGDGSEKEKLKAEIERSGISNVVFLPLAPANAFVDILRQANIHLVPQALSVVNYALPSKLFSIMAAGRPFICINKEGTPLDLLAKASRAGICISSDDPDAVYREVVALISDPDRQDQMGRNGQAFIKEHMNKEKILSCYEEIIGRCRK